MRRRQQGEFQGWHRTRKRILEETQLLTHIEKQAFWESVPEDELALVLDEILGAPGMGGCCNRGDRRAKRRRRDPCQDREVARNERSHRRGERQRTSRCRASVGQADPQRLAQIRPCSHSAWTIAMVRMGGAAFPIMVARSVLHLTLEKST